MQRMVDLEMESAGFGCITSEAGSQPQLEPDESIKEQSLPELDKQHSVFSLTFDEIQHKSGKSFGAMSMDEFLASVWNVEDNHVSLQPNEDANDDDKFITVQTSLSRQGSFSIPIPLCRKTVEEVWSEIHKDHSQRQIPDNSNNKNCQSLQTLGEMTLEDFLIKAGVVQQSRVGPCVYKSTPISSGNFNFSDAKSLDMSYGTVCTSIGLGFSDHLSTERKLFSNGFAPYQIMTQNGGVFGEPSDYSIIDNSNGMTDLTRQKSARIIDGPPEVVVQRRQRRMIKNRESAARSRARKQAYTVELEAELNQLKEENEKLKQVLAESDRKRREELMQQKQTTKAQKQAEKLQSMRRIMSVKW